LNTSAIIKAVGGCRFVFTGEEGITSGGFGENLKLALLRGGYTGAVDIFAVEDQMIRAGTVNQQLMQAKLDAQSVADRIKSTLKGTK